MMKIKCLIADDQSIIREGLKSLLQSFEDIEIVAEASNGQEAIHLSQVHHPDVILMDIRMPVMDGVLATKFIKDEYPQTIVIILTTFDDDQYILDALRYGASGYLLKDVSTSQLVTAIRDGYAGNILLPGRIATKISLMIQPGVHSHVTEEQEFSPREKDIIRLIVKGYSNKEISDSLYLSLGTVKNYVSQIYAKASVTDRSNAVIYFKNMGF